MTPLPRPRCTPRPIAPRCVALLALAALACGPTARPGPSAGTAPTPARSAAVPSFAYAPGRYVYELRNETVVYSPSDTTHRVDSLSSVAIVTYALERQPDGTLAAVGTVDSFTVATSASAGTPAGPRQLLQQPVTFRAELDSMGALRAFTTQQSEDCASPAGALLAAARGLFIGVPAHPTPGTRWTDSTSSTVCRADIPVTTKATQRYEVVQAGDAALRIRRASDIAVSGTGTQRGIPVTISGTGTATADLDFDPGQGRFIASTGDYEARLQFEAGGLTQPFIQRVRQRVVLRR